MSNKIGSSVLKRKPRLKQKKRGSITLESFIKADLDSSRVFYYDDEGKTFLLRDYKKENVPYEELVYKDVDKALFIDEYGIHSLRRGFMTVRTLEGLWESGAPPLVYSEKDYHWTETGTNEKMKKWFEKFLEDKGVKIKLKDKRCYLVRKEVTQFLDKVLITVTEFTAAGIKRPDLKFIRLLVDNVLPTASLKEMNDLLKGYKAVV